MDNSRGRSSIDSDCLQPAEVTQSPETTLDLKYSIILTQENRKFALSKNGKNLYIITSDENYLLFREYDDLGYNPEKTKSRSFFWHSAKINTDWNEQTGHFMNGASRVATSFDSSDTPRRCQVNIRDKTKTYKFTGKVSRIEVQNAIR